MHRELLSPRKFDICSLLLKVGYLYLTSIKRLDELVQHLLSQQIGVTHGSAESASL